MYRLFFNAVRRRKLPVFSIYLSWFLVGCASVPENSEHSSFSAYAEAVFRHQNEVSTRLIMLNEADQLPDNKEIDKAEEAMSRACRLLNEYAEREVDGDYIGMHFKFKVQESVEGCDESVKYMEAVLSKYTNSH